MRILGLDPATKTVGYGCIDLDPAVGVPVHVEHGIVKALDDDKDVRLWNIYRALKGIVERLQPDRGAIEDQFVHRNMRTGIIIAQSMGIGLAALFDRVPGFNVLRIPPASVKLDLCGNGRAEKDVVARFVALRLKIKAVTQLDASDALAVAIVAGQRLTGGKQMELAQGLHTEKAVAHLGDRARRYGNNKKDGQALQRQALQAGLRKAFRRK